MRWVSRREGGFGQKPERLVFAEAPSRDELERIDIDAFFLDAPRLRAHRAGRNPADIGMVPARGDEEEKVGTVLAEDRRDDGDIGKMGAAVIGSV